MEHWYTVTLQVMFAVYPIAQVGVYHCWPWVLYTRSYTLSVYQIIQLRTVCLHEDITCPIFIS